MRKYPITKYLSIFNLLVISLALLDCFVLPTVQVEEQVKSTSYNRTRGKHSSYMTIEIVAQSGHQYEFSDRAVSALDFNSTFIVHKSMLFRLPQAIHYQFNQQFYIGMVSYLKDNYIVLGVLLLTAAFSIYDFFNKKRSENAKKNLIVMSIFLYCGIVYIMFIQMRPSGMF